MSLFMRSVKILLDAVNLVDYKQESKLTEGSVTFVFLKNFIESAARLGQYNVCAER